MKETCYIYGLRAKDATEFFYVGSTKRDLEWRLGKHKNHCVSGLHRNPEFTRVVKEIGVDNIVIDLIEEVNQDQRFQRERHWINTLPNLINVVKKPDGSKRQYRVAELAEWNPVSDKELAEILTQIPPEGNEAPQHLRSYAYPEASTK